MHKNKTDLVSQSAQSGPRDVFLHLFALIALYVNVIFLGYLVFSLINLYLPDPLEYERVDSSALRWPIAVLTVMFPLYLWANYVLQKDISRYPEKRKLKSRKWLLYLTLFIAAGVIAVDLIALILSYLEGELTARFLLKVATVFLIAVSVFLYYGWNVKKETPATKDFKMNLLLKGSVGIVFIIIIVGYLSVGSPQAERLRRLDDIRVSDLRQIQYQVIQFWRMKKRLPNSLDELSDMPGFVPARDPKTGEEYEYRTTGELSFELCAAFQTPSQEDKTTLSRPYPITTFPGENVQWTHGVGRECFERIIDPDFYLNPEFRKFNY